VNLSTRSVCCCSEASLAACAQEGDEKRDDRWIDALDFIQNDLFQIEVGAPAFVETTSLTDTQDYLVQQATDIHRGHIMVFAGQRLD